MKCFICNKGTLHKKVDQVERSFEGYSRKVPLHYAECDNAECSIGTLIDGQDILNVEEQRKFLSEANK